MDSEYRIYLSRAENELNLALIIQKISNEKHIQPEIFGLKEDTYYSAVISHAYYSIFYAAKAYLITKGIKVKAPEEHKKAFDEFYRLVEEGVVDSELLMIYRKMITRAEILLEIFHAEKSKRGRFTYKRIAQANKEPADESIDNACFFLKQIFSLCKKSK